MKMTKNNFNIIEKVSGLIDLYFSVTDDDELDLDYSTDANGAIDIVSGTIDKYNRKTRTYTRYSIRLNFDDDGEPISILFQKKGTVVGKRKM